MLRPSSTLLFVDDIPIGHDHMWMILPLRRSVGFIWMNNQIEFFQTNDSAVLGGKLMPASIVRFRKRQRGQNKSQYIHRIFTNGVNNVEWIPSIFFTSNMAHVYQTQVVAHIIWMILCFLNQIVNGFHNI